jgi:hypothetical protein
MASSEIEKLRRVVNARDQLLDYGLSLLKASLRRDNFVNFIQEFVPQLLGGDCRVTIHDSWAEKENECNSIEVYIESISDELLDELVAVVFPYTESEERSPDTWFYHIISKAQYLNREREWAAELAEDHIHDAVQFLAYKLRNDIDRAREKYIRKTSQAREVILGGDWNELATDVYRGYSIRSRGREEVGKHYRQWAAKHRRAMWCNLHGHLLDICLALAPLHLSSYELLWILDYLPPMNFKCYKDGKPYDANHLRKLRLYESTMKSYKLIRP